MNFAFANIFLAVSIDLVKSTEPLRLSLSFICCSNRSDAAPLSTGTDAIAIAIIVFTRAISALLGAKVMKFSQFQLIYALRILFYMDF